MAVEGVGLVKPGSFTAGASALQLPCSPASGVAPASGAALAGRRAITITNEDDTLYARLGDATIAAASGGLPIGPKQTVSIDALAHCVLYVIADSGTPLVSWLEVA